MLKRKVFVKYENESNEEFENRLNEFLKENDHDYKEDDQIGHYCHISNDGTTSLILFYHASKEDPQKTKIGF